MSPDLQRATQIIDELAAAEGPVDRAYAIRIAAMAGRLAIERDNAHADGLRRAVEIIGDVHEYEEAPKALVVLAKVRRALEAEAEKAQGVSKHTPGKWWIDEGFSLGTIVVGSDDDGYIIAKCDREPDEWRANARLIAAAPELLEAATFARDALDDLAGGEATPDEMVRSVSLLCAAIAAATGEPNA